MKLMRISFVASMIVAVLLVIGCQPPAASATSSLGNLSGSNPGVPDNVQQPSSQQQQPQPTAQPTSTPVATATVEFGGSTEISGTAGAVQVTFVIDQPQFVNILARSNDGTTNPRIYLYTASERLLTFSDDYTARRDDLNDIDALIEDAFLIPGSYSIRVETAGGDGKVTVGIEPATGGVLGLGQLTTIRAEITAGNRYYHPMPFSAGELISIMAISESDTFDPRLSLRSPEGVQLTKNDDTDSFDIVLDVTDAKIENFVIPATGTYRLEVRGFSTQDTGSVQLLVFRYGTLENATAPEVLSGSIMQRQRLDFPLQVSAGELISVTARAAGSQLDPQIALLDTDNVVVISNDDHGTNDTDIDTYDARFTNYITQSAGEYTLSLESVGGRGNYEVVIQRFGVLNPALVGDPIDVNAGVVVTPAPTPESTAEVTPGS